MKLLLAFMLLLGASSSCKRSEGTADVKSSGKSSVVVDKARYDAVHKSIVISIRYGGGFVAKHKFKLALEGACLESIPQQCKATLFDLTADAGESLLPAEITVTLKEAGLENPDYSNASLTIHGKNNSQATISLPAMD